MYADDLVLISSSICELQKMLDLCADDLTEIGMQINSKKCVILRFGPQYANSCTTIWFQDSPIDFCDKAAVSSCSLYLSYCKAKLYRAFNGLFHRLAKLRNELTTLHLGHPTVSHICSMPLNVLPCLLRRCVVCSIPGNALFLIFSTSLALMLTLYVRRLIDSLWMLS